MMRERILHSTIRSAARRRSALLAGTLAGAMLLSGRPAKAAGATKAATPTETGASAERVRALLERRPLRTLDGKTVSLRALQGDVVVVNFWASWCSPCRRELPALNKLHHDIAKQGGRVVAISIDEDIQNVHRFVDRHHLDMPVVHDGPDGLARDLDLKHIPFTVVLDRGGAVAFTTSGSDKAALDRLTRQTLELLDGHPAAAASEGDAR